MNDVTFEKDGKHYSFRVAEDRDGKKIFQVRDISLLPDSMITGEASYSSYSPQRQMITQQTDWRGGLQDLMFEDPTKYYRSINTDARFKGKVILSGKQVDTTISTPYRKIKNPNFEDWTSASDADDWTEAGGVAKTTDSYNGDYAAKLDKSGATNGKVSQSLPWTDDLQGKTLTLKAYCKVESSPTTAKIYVYDGQDTNFSANITGTSYAQISIAHTVNDSATELTIYAECDSENKYLYVDAVTIEYSTTTLLEPTAMAVFESKLYAAYGKYLFCKDNDGVAVVREFPENITDLCIYGSNLFIAQGYNKYFWYTGDGWSFTENDEEYDATPMGAKKMANIGNAQFWISYGANLMADVIDPTNGEGTDHTFSTDYTVMNDAYEITDLIDHPDMVFVRKQDQVYYLSGSDVIPLIEGLDIEANTDIDYPLYFWKDKLYIPSGVNALYEYDVTDGTVETVSPVRFATGDTKYDGKIRGICADGDYLYITVETNIQTLILSGRWETIGGTTDWRWHPIYEEDNPNVTPPLLIANVAEGKRLYSGVIQFTGQTSPTGHTAGDWTDEANAYDGDVSTLASIGLVAETWSAYLELTHSGVACSVIAYYGGKLWPDIVIDIDAYYDSAYHDVWQGTNERTGWWPHDMDGTHTVSKVRIRFYNPYKYYTSVWLYEVTVGGVKTYGLRTAIVPTSYADPTSEMGYEFESPGDFFTGWIRTAFSDLDKYNQALRVTSKCRDDGELAVYYQLKGAGDPTDSDNWVLLGRCTQNDVIFGNYPEEYTDVMPIEKASERIRFKYHLSSTDDDYSPILMGWQLLSRIAGTVMQVEMTLKVGVRGTMSTGAISNKTVKQQIEDLEMLKKSVAPITLTDLLGVKRTVLFSAPGLREYPYVIGKNQEEWRCDVILLEAT